MVYHRGLCLVYQRHEPMERVNFDHSRFTFSPTELFRHHLFLAVNYSAPRDRIAQSRVQNIAPSRHQSTIQSRVQNIAPSRHQSTIHCGRAVGKYQSFVRGIFQLKARKVDLTVLFLFGSFYKLHRAPTRIISTRGFFMATKKR